MKTCSLQLVLCVISLLPAAARADKADELAAEYARAKGEVEKRAVCIDAIDARVIGRGASIATIKKIFGRDFEENGGDSDDKRFAIVCFVPARLSTNQLESVALRGWYLSIAYDAKGKVHYYSLSNCGKASYAAVLDEQTKTNAWDARLPAAIVIESTTNSNQQKQGLSAPKK